MRSTSTPSCRRFPAVASTARGALAVAFATAVVLVLTPAPGLSQDTDRPRARDLGIEVGVFQPGEHNAITDVSGVRVGHATVIREPDVRTGVTAILPHGGNPYRSRVPAAIHVGNGYGKLLGVTQVRELGEMETPILLTCTLCVWKAADAMVEWMLARDGMENVRSLNALVGETNDGGLNDIRSRPIEPNDVVEALESASTGSVAEGAVGAGAGTVAFGWKGGIGTSSRILPGSLGGYTVGVLVQSNFGGILQIDGAPVGQELGQYAFANQVGRDADYDPDADVQEWGSIMVVVATDAPLSDRNLERVARRAIMGLSRTGSYASNGSGDYVIAFSTANGVRRGASTPEYRVDELANGAMSALFQATVEATEEAIYNSLFRATTVTSNGRTVEALPLDATVEILRRYGVVR
ncbi:MAG: P1 family peptidase [Longimicrobiales bacterium]|nr:P1 family peptidase [Longimicrobiales bacterium]